MNTCTLRARLVPQIQLIGRMTADMQLRGSIRYLEGYETYTGNYEVTPQVLGQTIPTANRLMVRDVTIKDIPTYEVSNPSGGETFYIASEV